MSCGGTATSTDTPPPAAPRTDAGVPGAPRAFGHLLETVSRRYAEADLDAMHRAFRMAAKAHAGQKRASGEPYIMHPLAVAQILAGLNLDPPTIAAALLHDVVEDTVVNQAALEEEFGSEIAQLVAGVTKISAIEAREVAASEAESLRRLFLAAVGDLRVILIKVADRLHNMRTLDALDSERRQHLAQETLEIYAPLANRLGIWQLKSELEDLALRELEPEVFGAIHSELTGRHGEHEQYLTDVIRQLDQRLRAAGMAAQISSRTKHYYSVYKKMLRKDLRLSEISEIYDVLAARVLVDAPEQCYLVLGVVHTMWPPVEGEFDDYIAKPKNNLYQSLHTTVLGPGNRPLEVQIRTHEMHDVAEYGVAAHWLYKEDSPRAR